MDTLATLREWGNRFPKKIIVPTLITTVFYFSLNLFIPLISPYALEIIGDEFLLSIVFSLFPLTMIIATPMIGHLADAIGRKRVIFAGMVFQFFAVFFYMTAENIWWFALGRIFNGIGYIAVTLIALVKIEDSLEDKSRGFFSGLALSVLHLGAVFGPILGGYLAERYAPKFVFYVSFTIVLGLIAFSLVFYKSKTPKSKRKKLTLSDFVIVDEIKQFLRIQSMRGMALLGMAMHGSQPALRVFLPLIIIQQMGLGYSEIGTAFFVFGLLHSFEFVSGYIADKLGRGYTVLTGTGMVALGFLGVGMVDEWWQLLGIMAIMGMAGSLWNTGAWTMMSDIGERLKHQGGLVGSYTSLAKVGGFVMFIVSGAIVKFFGYAALMYVNAFLIGAASIAGYYYFRTGKTL